MRAPLDKAEDIVKAQNTCDGRPLDLAFAAANSFFGFGGAGGGDFRNLGLDGANVELLRSSASILAKMSLFSLRKARVFSRPWPMRSPA